MSKAAQAVQEAVNEMKTKRSRKPKAKAARKPKAEARTEAVLRGAIKAKPKMKNLFVNTDGARAAMLVSLRAALDGTKADLATDLVPHATRLVQRLEARQ